MGLLVITKMKIFSHSFTLYGDFSDNTKLWNDVLSIVNKSGATVVGTLKHDFYPQGLSGCILLAESHVAFHSYPEEELCFVYLATCGSEKLGKDIIFGFELLYDIIERS